MRRLSQFLTLFLMIALLIFIGCEGPSGTEGPQGSEGPEGPVGPAGEDGSMMYSGEGEPDTEIGDIGDYYLNTNTGEMYGPKDDDGWGNSIIVLMGDDGADGQDGEDGSQIHSGSGAPDASLGVEGDYYLNEDSYDLYGPKTGSGWGTPLNLKGADGNANVTRYIFPGHDFSSSPDTTLHIDDLSESEARNSAWNVYLVTDYTNTNEIDAYHIPGWIDSPFGVNSGQYSVSLHTFASSPQSIYISLIDGSGDSFDNIYVVRIAANNTQDQTKRAGEAAIIPEDLDISDYEAVAEYYGFYHE